jgi:hypothetical protein
VAMCGLGEMGERVSVWCTVIARENRMETCLSFCLFMRAVKCSGMSSRYIRKKPLRTTEGAT